MAHLISPVAHLIYPVAHLIYPVAHLIYPVAQFNRLLIIPGCSHNIPGGSLSPGIMSDRLN